MYVWHCGHFYKQHCIECTRHDVEILGASIAFRLLTSSLWVGILPMQSELLFFWQRLLLCELHLYNGVHTSLPCTTQSLCHVAHNTPQSSILVVYGSANSLDYTTYMTKLFVRGTMPFLLYRNKLQTCWMDWTLRHMLNPHLHPNTTKVIIRKRKRRLSWGRGTWSMGLFLKERLKAPAHEDMCIKVIFNAHIAGGTQMPRHATHSAWSPVLF